MLHPSDMKMNANPEKAESLGSRMVFFKDSLVKQRVEVLDVAALRQILDDTSHDAMAAEQELVMAWRFYSQEREQQVAWGEFHFCSSPDEIEAARSFSQSKKIIFDPENVKGVECIKSKITATIECDILIDAIKWQAVETHDAELKNKIRAMYKYGPSTVAIPLETPDPDREKFVEGNFQWCKSRDQAKFRKYFIDRIADAIRRMLDEHRDFWAQRPTEPYNDSGLIHVFGFAFDGPNHGLGHLFMAWRKYLESRIFALDYRHGAPFEKCTDEEKASAKEERRKLPIEWPHSHPNAREIAESHIKAIIREDIVADSEKWERHKKSLEAAKERFQEHRLKRIGKCKDAFAARVREMFGQQVLDLISEEDIHRYGLGVVDRQGSEEDLWYSILKQYDFDQNTSSCLYFVRQENFIKIGVTDNLKQRFAQLKTSASLPLKIENVVYTHHGRTLERKLHQALADYNTHLEWFSLPSRMERLLFAAKSVEDIENFLRHITDEKSKGLLEEPTDASAASRTRQRHLF